MNKSIKNFLKNWAGVFALIGLVILIIFSVYYYNELSNKISVTNRLLRERIKKIEDEVDSIQAENLLDNMMNNPIQDPYSQNLQKVNESFDISFKNIKKYGSGAKITFTLLNKDSVSYQNIAVNFQLRDSNDREDFNVLAHKKHEILEKIESGYARTETVTFKEMNPSQLKAIKVKIGSKEIQYRQHY